MKHLGAKAIEYRKADIGAVPARIVMDAEGARPDRRIDDVDDAIGNSAWIGIVGHDLGECFLHLGAEPPVGTAFLIFGEPRSVSRASGMREMIGPACERAGDDDRCLYAPPGELAGIL